jgi:hypothetical protein
MIPMNDNDDDNIDDIDDIDDIEVGIEMAPVVDDAMMLPVKKINYLNNKDMLKEIHKSKNSFSEYIDPKYCDYDVIVSDVNDIFLPEVQEKGRISRAARMGAAAFAAAVAANTSRTEKPKLSEHKVKPDTISNDVLIYRVLTFEHIPFAPGRKKNPKSEADSHIKLNFAPFKHYIIENGSPKEVGRSHSKNGKFNLEKGSITNTLAKMFILMVHKYGQRGNWRGYTYIDEMKGQALLQLAQMGLQFDESKSDNPFSYYTQSLQNSFTRVLNLEKKNQDLRDDLLIDSGASPSFSRQLALEADIRQLREDAQEAAKDDN